jgi:Grx4 family monothiol glutaredoxin
VLVQQLDVACAANMPKRVHLLQEHRIHCWRAIWPNAHVSVYTMHKVLETHKLDAESSALGSWDRQIRTVTMLAGCAQRTRARVGASAHKVGANSFNYRRNGCQAVRRQVSAAAQAYSEVEPQDVLSEGQPAQLPVRSGVYAVFDNSSSLQYVGISRNVQLSIDAHHRKLGKAVVHAVKVGVIDNATKDDLTTAWKEWLQAGVDDQGGIPPGNAGPEKEKWQGKAKPKAKPEIKLTAGKGADDVTVSITELVDMVVKNERIVAFVKGTRTQPQCGFSHQLLETLNSMKAEYQVVNVLDEVYNPGLREGIKEYSAWPTIPQLYINGDFVGGSDIVQEMAASGELAKIVSGGKA